MKFFASIILFHSSISHFPIKNLIMFYHNISLDYFKSILEDFYSPFAMFLFVMPILYYYSAMTKMPQ